MTQENVNEIISERTGSVKNYKKIIISIITLVIILFAAAKIVNFESENGEYATLDPREKANSSVFLNDSTEYVSICYYYSYKKTPDLKIRNGKNIFLSLFKKPFGAYSSDSERIFLYCNEKDMHMFTGGLYIKKSSIKQILTPTSDNIYRIRISKDYKDVLVFSPKDKECFSYFLDVYKKELVNYIFPLGSENENNFNEEYRIDVEYLDGSLSRFFKRIPKSEFDAIRIRL